MATELRRRRTTLTGMRWKTICISRSTCPWVAKAAALPTMPQTAFLVCRPVAMCRPASIICIRCSMTRSSMVSCHCQDCPASVQSVTFRSEGMARHMGPTTSR